MARAHGFTGDDRSLITDIRARTFAQMRAGALTLDIIVPVLPFHHEIMKRAVRMPMSGSQVPVATAEDLFVLKALWFRPKDVADLHVLATIGDRLDRNYVRKKLRELLPADDPRVAEVDRILA